MANPEHVEILKQGVVVGLERLIMSKQLVSANGAAS